jgi:hypothetical protein
MVARLWQQKVHFSVLYPAGYVVATLRTLFYHVWYYNTQVEDCICGNFKKTRFGIWQILTVLLWKFNALHFTRIREAVHFESFSYEAQSLQHYTALRHSQDKCTTAFRTAAAVVSHCHLLLKTLSLIQRKEAGSPSTNCFFVVYIYTYFKHNGDILSEIATHHVTRHNTPIHNIL